ncbi:MAG: DUF6600 domain-containing protein [Bryobacteraceae bacterium]|nr:DUF6600 domain-containing protein [Bryobacteraceae bacterium]
MKFTYPLLAAVTILAGCAHSSANVPTAPTPSANDPPSRVARISYLRGEVSLRVGGVEDWRAATANRPLTSGDELWTGDGGRAELHTGNAALRLDSRTSVTLTEVGSGAIQVKLTEGRLSLHVRDLEEDETFEIDTPDAAISLLRAGSYRIEVSAGGPGTTVIARSGMAELSGPGVSLIVRQGQEARVPGEVTKARPTDSFDEFCSGRDQREERALASRHVSTGVIGYEDLDEYGEWRTYPDYGWGWLPRGVPPGWAPYRFGHWVWIAPWGWTWMDDAPWGFAPFHYGRWVVVGAQWVWIPGPYHRRPIYAPALVVFIGGGGPGLRIHFRLEAGFGVAWFPLGPREIWFPPYRASRTYVTNVNITHTVVHNVANIHRTNITRQRYVNREVEHAVTAVPEDVFRRAQPVQRGAVRISAREAASASIGGSAPPVAPVRESMTRGERAAAPTVNRERREVIVNRRSPAPTKPGEAGRQQPQPTTRRDQQWEQRTRREESQRQERIAKERQQDQRSREKQQRKK